MAQVEIIKPNLKTENVNVFKNKKKNVCAYARVSTDSEEQFNAILNFLDENARNGNRTTRRIQKTKCNET